jgi:hypothetical protein
VLRGTWLIYDEPCGDTREGVPAPLPGRPTLHGLSPLLGREGGSSETVVKEPHMADTTLPSPTTPRVFQAKLPQWIYWAILLLIIPAAAGTIYLTRVYAVANLSLLQLDSDSLQARRLSIDVLLFVHVVAFFVAPILFDTRLKWRRRQLMALGFAIWLFDCAALYQSRVGIMISAESVQTTAGDRAAKKQETIDSLRRQVVNLQKLAATQLSLDRVKAATATTAEATTLEKEANRKAAELEKEPAGTGLTEVKVWGAAAKWKALVESLLISAGTLVMLGVMGAIVRVMLERVAPAVEGAAAALSRQDNPPIKKGMGYVLRSLLAALGIGAAAAGATAGQAPTAAPAVTTSGQQGVTTSGQAEQGDKTAETARQEKKARTPTKRGTNGVRDTGVTGNSAERFKAVRAGILAGTIKPSISGIRAVEGGCKETASRYLKEMAAAGELVPHGRGWKLNK